jgi:hypothetical protein
MSNIIITPTNDYATVIPLIETIVLAKGGRICSKYEVEAGVLRASPFAWDIGAEIAPLHAAIEKIDTDKAAAAIAAAAMPPTKESLKALIANRRWEEETKGTVVDFGAGRTLPIMTDATSQSKLTGLLVIASAQPVAVKWKGSDGSFLEINNADVLVMAGTVFAYVQACFMREAALLDLLVATNDTETFKATIETFW